MRSVKKQTSLSDLTFSLMETGQRLIITSKVIEHLDRNRQKKFIQPEVGGQLFAKFINGDIHVCKATGPYKADFKQRFSFFANRKRERKDIKTYFKLKLHYVGDWHSHPEKTPSPSSIDLESMKECFLESHHELQSFIMIIIGTEESLNGIWLSLHNANGFKRLFPVPKDTL